MSGRWIKKNQARSEWGRRLAKKRWAKHRASVDEKIKKGELMPPPAPWPFDVPLFEISVKLNRTGITHRFELFRSKTGRVRKQWQAKEANRGGTSALSNHSY